MRRLETGHGDNGGPPKRTSRRRNAQTFLERPTEVENPWSASIASETAPIFSLVRLNSPATTSGNNRFPACQLLLRCHSRISSSVISHLPQRLLHSLSSLHVFGANCEARDLVQSPKTHTKVLIFCWVCFTFPAMRKRSFKLYTWRVVRLKKSPRCRDRLSRRRMRPSSSTPRRRWAPARSTSCCHLPSSYPRLACRPGRHPCGRSTCRPRRRGPKAV